MVMTTRTSAPMCRARLRSGGAHPQALSGGSLLPARGTPTSPIINAAATTTFSSYSDVADAGVAGEVIMLENIKVHRQNTYHLIRTCWVHCSSWGGGLEHPLPGTQVLIHALRCTPCHQLPSVT